MDEDGNQHQSEFNSFHLDEVLSNRMSNLKKKRKFQAEQLGLPVSKHKCGDLRLTPEPLFTLEENREVEFLITSVSDQKREKQVIDVGSDPESGKDSNSFVEDSDSSMSASGESKFETEVSKAWPSTSSFVWDSSCFKDTKYSSDKATATRVAEKEAATSVECELDPSHLYTGIQVTQNLEEPMLEFGSDSEYGHLEHINDSIEQCTDKELDALIYSNGVPPNMFVLSSGRWTINQDAQPGKRKPTIDQEFEQYFSTLML